MGELGVALLFIVGAALPAMPATGALIDRFGPRVLPGSAVLFGIAVLLSGVADSVWQRVKQAPSPWRLVGLVSGALDLRAAITLLAAIAVVTSVAASSLGDVLSLRRQGQFGQG